MNNEKYFNPIWTYTFNIDNIDCRAKSIIEDSDNSDIFYVAGYGSSNSSLVFILKVDETIENNPQFSCKKINIPISNEVKVGQLVDLKNDELVVSYQRWNSATEYDTYISLLKKDINDLSINTSVYLDDDDNKAFNLINQGFADVATGTEAMNYPNYKLKLITSHKKEFACTDDEEYTCSSIAVIPNEITNASITEITRNLTRPDVVVEPINVDPNSECSEEPCYCDKEFITSKVSLVDNDPNSLECCYKIEYWTKPQTCPVDAVEYILKDQQGNIVYSESRNINFGSGQSYTDDDAHEICVSDNLIDGRATLNIQFKYNGQTLDCVHTFEIGCKCNCDDYETESDFEFELIPVEIEDNPCCYDIYLKNNNPCGISDETIIIRYNDDIHGHFNLTLESDWSETAAIQDGDFWDLPILSPTTKRIASNDKPVKIGTFCYTTPEYPEIPLETISFSIEPCEDYWEFNINCEKGCCANINNYNEEPPIEIYYNKTSDCCYEIRFKYGNVDILENCKLSYIELVHPSGYEEIIQDAEWYDYSNDPEEIKTFNYCIPEEQKTNEQSYEIKLKFMNKSGYTICEKELELNLDGCGDNCCDENLFIEGITCETDQSGNYIVRFDPNLQYYPCTIYGIKITTNSYKLSRFDLEGQIDYNKFEFKPLSFPISFTLDPNIADLVTICLYNKSLEEICCFEYVLLCVGTGGLIKPIENDINITPDSLLELTKIYFYPNPSSNETLLSFFSNISANIKIKLFKTNGDYITTIEDFVCKEGINSVNIDTRELRTNTYLISISSNQRIYSTQLVIIK